MNLNKITISYSNIELNLFRLCTGKDKFHMGHQLSLYFDLNNNMLSINERTRIHIVSKNVLSFKINGSGSFENCEINITKKDGENRIEIRSESQEINLITEDLEVTECVVNIMKEQ